MPSRYLAPQPGRNLSAMDPMLDLHREMNRFFDEMFRGGSLADVRAGMQLPRVDLHEKDGELCVTAELPGVAKDDLELQLNGDMLTISGEKKDEHEQEQRNYYMSERSYGRFQRTIQLPCSPRPDQVKASFENGILNVRMPRGDGQSSHRIQLEGQPQEPSGQAGAQEPGPAAGTTAGRKTHH